MMANALNKTQHNKKILKLGSLRQSFCTKFSRNTTEKITKKIVNRTCTVKNLVELFDSNSLIKVT